MCACVVVILEGGLGSGGLTVLNFGMERVEEIYLCLSH